MRQAERAYYAKGRFYAILYFRARDVFAIYFSRRVIASPYRKHLRLRVDVDTRIDLEIYLMKMSPHWSISAPCAHLEVLSFLAQARHWVSVPAVSRTSASWKHLQYYYWTYHRAIELRRIMRKISLNYHLCFALDALLLFQFRITRKSSGVFYGVKALKKKAGSLWRQPGNRE